MRRALRAPFNARFPYGQELRLSSTPACDSCEIEIEPLLSFGRQEGSEFLDGGAYVFEEGEEYFFSVLRAFLYEIGIFDKDGQFVGSVGSQGEGPGEYRFIVDVESGPGDSLYVFDSGNQRVTVLNPEFDVERTFPLRGRGGQRGVAFLPAGTFLDRHGYWDTLVGVMDPTSGKLLDLVRTPDWYLCFTRPGVLLSEEADEFDRTIMHLWAVSLDRSESGLGRAAERPG